MRRLATLLRRHGLALGLTIALLGVFWGAALPAIEERARARSDRRAAERELKLRTDELRVVESWLSGLEQGDPQLRARLAQERLRSAEVEGPVLVQQPAPDDDASR